MKKTENWIDFQISKPLHHYYLPIIILPDNITDPSTVAVEKDDACAVSNPSTLDQSEGVASELPPVDDLQCKTCNETFLTYTSLNKHKRLKHSGESVYSFVY